MKKRILEQILSGVSDQNIRFADLKGVLASYGFDERIKGDHHIFTKTNVHEIINIQPLRDGKAKPYQVKQVRNIIFKYHFHRGA
ncbi:MAG: type II toxin-antitoxin system HicA family toxin [Pseudomonadota bacterium]